MVGGSNPPTPFLVGENKMGVTEMNQIKLLHSIRAMHAWARGEKCYLDVAFALGIGQDSLLKLMLDNFLCYADGKITDDVSEVEAVECILLAMILHERHERLNPKYRKPRR